MLEYLIRVITMSVCLTINHQIMNMLAMGIRINLLTKRKNSR